ncbi:MAG: 4-hydroxythreonine-4-phosphate dehydrogenase PdxA [Bacteriovoracia bacterium]
MPSNPPLPPVVLITPGDPNGIGPEVVAKVFRKSKFPKSVRFVCVGAEAPLKKLRVKYRIPGSHAELGGIRRAKPGTLWLLPTPNPPAGFTRTAKAGFQSGWSISASVKLLQAGSADALVTGPISKENLQAGGFPYHGHTDFLADLARPSPEAHAVEVTMMLANSQLRVSLVTVHQSLRQVPDSLTREGIVRAVMQTWEHLTGFCGISRPKIAVTALNPHAGEAGILGREEIEIITPALDELRAKLGRKCELTGPHPADTLFAMNQLAKPKERVDAVVCMYHDQGLIPVKLLDFPNTVNLTLGLPFIRTSVDHGTGFDIAGRGIADPSSMESAIWLALDMIQKSR